MDEFIDYEKRINQIFRELDAPRRWNASKLLLFPEASELVSIGLDLYGREQKLTPKAAASWAEMHNAAGQDGEVLQIVSAFRSVDYQKRIIQRKLVAGQTWEQILRVSALPGCSEHHTGKTIDVTTPGFEPLTEEFENSSAFKWLTRRAVEFGFSMTYPRDNKFGIAYEPWHWTMRRPL